MIPAWIFRKGREEKGCNFKIEFEVLEDAQVFFSCTDCSFTLLHVCLILFLNSSTCFIGGRLIQDFLILIDR